jgi:hypothetical protein
MIKMEAVERELFEGHVAGGLTLWAAPDSNVVLYQFWEHKAAGRVLSEVEVSYKSPTQDLGTHFIEQEWDDDYIIIDVKDLS